MNELFLVRVFAYSLFPVLLAGSHMFLDRQAHTTARRIELVLLYVMAISVGANGLSGAFGHLFLSDMVADGVGWAPGSPFQLEMGFANLALGVLGLMAISRRAGFRMATIIATTVIGLGATIVHLQDIVAHGNLAPGNTIQNVSNLLDPALLIGLSWWSSRLTDPDIGSDTFRQWQVRQQPIAGLTAAGIGIGFGIGFAAGGLLLWTVLGALLGAVVGVVLSKRMSPPQDLPSAGQLS